MENTKMMDESVGNSWFSWHELTFSRTAIEYDLDNEPGEAATEALINLTLGLLDLLREAYGKKIRVTSGYRSKEVNRLVGGEEKSQHRRGEAADLVIPEGPETLLKVLMNAKIPFDQAIVYRKRGFLHVSLKVKGNNRNQVLWK